MMIDKKNEKVKSIMESARKLFYDHGYDNTQLSQIASDCEISKQLLSYYFPSKEVLCKEFCVMLQEESNDIVQKKINRYFENIKDPILLSALDIKLGGLLFLCDEKASRFYRECLKKDFSPALSLFTPHADRTEKICEESGYQLNTSIDEAQILSRVFLMASQIIQSDFSLGLYKNCSKSELLDYLVYLLLSVVKVKSERIQQANQFSNSLIEMLELKFLPYFYIE